MASSFLVGIGFQKSVWQQTNVKGGWFERNTIIQERNKGACRLSKGLVVMLTVESKQSKEDMRKLKNVDQPLITNHYRLNNALQNILIPVCVQSMLSYVTK